MAFIAVTQSTAGSAKFHRFWVPLFSEVAYKRTLFQPLAMHHKRFGLNYQTLKIVFGESTARRTKPFEKRSSARTFFSIFGKT